MANVKSDPPMNSPDPVELLPCPFCGARPAISKLPNGFWHIECQEDDACKVSVDALSQDRAEAERHWNTRANQPCGRIDDATVERAWAAIVGNDVAPICFQASIIRADLKTALEAVATPPRPDREALAEALKPFADAWTAYGDKPSDETTINDNRGAAYLESIKITFGDLRRAHAALAAPQPVPEREALTKAHEAFAIAIAFLGRDIGTERLTGTVEAITKQLVAADKIALAALAAQPEREGMYSRDEVRNDPTISPAVKDAMEHFWKKSDEYERRDQQKVADDE